MEKNIDTLLDETRKELLRYGTVIYDNQNTYDIRIRAIRYGTKIYCMKEVVGNVSSIFIIS